MNIDDFGELLRQRAHWTHDIIKKSSMYRLGIMEETLTDMHLFSIADSFKENILTKKFNRREEGAKSGADWLWIIGEPGSWLPLLVQAKIVNPQTGNCQHLDYKNGEQRKKLLHYARQHSLVPLYCIYSMIPPGFTPVSYWGQYKRSPEDWACSFVSPRSIRLLSAAGIKSQYAILKYAIPWMDPFCLQSKANEYTGDAIARRIENLRDDTGIKEVHRLSGKIAPTKSVPLRTRTNWENLDSVQTVKETIPPSICKLFCEQQTNNSSVPFSGASIISSVPIKQIQELKP